MTVTEIEEFKTMLETEKMAMTNQLAALQKDQSRASGPVSADFEEQATETENDEVIDALSGLDSDKLVKIDAALSRITNGSYGSCVSCGADIENKRLKAVPYAATCIKCS